MSRIHLFLLLFLSSTLLLCSNKVISQEQPTRIKLGEAIAVTLPSDPFVNSTALQDQYGVNNEDGLFQAIFLKSHLDATIQYESLDKIKEFYAGYLNGMRDKIQGEIISVKFAQIKGYVSVDGVLNYTAPVTGEAMTIKVRTITLLGRIYSLTFTHSTRDFPEFEPIGDQFLNSLVVLLNAKDEPLDPGGPLYDSEAKSAGDMIWRAFILIFIVLCVTIIAVYFGTRKSKRERANEVNNL